MNVTIISDASFCPVEQVAGYGFWVASSRGKFGGGGVCAPGTVVITSTVAEMMAVCNSVWKAMERGFLIRGDTVLLQTDCMAAIQAFRLQRNNLNVQEEKAVQYIQHVKEVFEIEMHYRHVKGHSQVEDARSVTNRVCDKTAKQYMRIERTRTKVEKLKALLLNKE